MLINVSLANFFSWKRLSWNVSSKSNHPSGSVYSTNVSAGSIFLKEAPLQEASTVLHGNIFPANVSSWNVSSGSVYSWNITTGSFSSRNTHSGSLYFGTVSSQSHVLREHPFRKCLLRKGPFRKCLLSKGPFRKRLLSKWPFRNCLKRLIQKCLLRKCLIWKRPSRKQLLWKRLFWIRQFRKRSLLPTSRFFSIWKNILLGVSSAPFDRTSWIFFSAYSPP